MADFSKIAPNIIVGTDATQDMKQIRASAPEAYRNDVLAAMNAIWDGSWTGTAVIQAIAQKPGTKVVITPFLDPECNSESNARPDWAKSGEINVRFTPSDWSSKGSCSKGGPGATPDAMLLHELVHAYRQMQGHIPKVRTQVPGFQYENEHEFYAILLANIHLSAKSVQVLRRDHDGFKMLYPELASSEPFLRNFIEHRRLVEIFVRENSQLCNTVCMDACVFNPIDYFVKNRAAMLELNKRPPAPPGPQDLATRKLLQQHVEESLKYKQ